MFDCLLQKRVMVHIIPAVLMLGAISFLPEKGIVHGPCTTLPIWVRQVWAFTGFLTWISYGEIAYQAWTLHDHPSTSWLPRWLLPGVTLFVGTCGLGHLLASVGLQFWARWDLVAFWQGITAAISVPVALAIALGSNSLKHEAMIASWGLHETLVNLGRSFVYRVRPDNTIVFSIGDGWKLPAFRKFAPNGFLEDPELMHLSKWIDEGSILRDTNIDQVRKTKKQHEWVSRSYGYTWLNTARPLPGGDIVIEVQNASKVASEERYRIMDEVLGEE